MNRIFRDGLLFFICFIISCSQNQKIPDNIILAEIGDKVITIQDFIRRAEYTIRPPYCSQGNYIHKKIILNSLIAEKLTALEFEKSSISASKNKNFQAYLTGRKEQAMRQKYFAEEYYAKTVIPDEEMKTAYTLSQRKVRIDYLNLPDLKTVNKVQKILMEGVTLDSINSILWGGDVPSREITWFNKESDDIHDALFNPDLKKGQIIGPFSTEDNTFIIMTVSGWTTQPMITENDQILAWKDVNERLTENKSRKVYLKWVEGLMSGKSFELNPDVFGIYAKRASIYYLKSDSEKQKSLNQALWETPELLDQAIFTIPNEPDLDENGILFRYNDNEWTIDKFHALLKAHPLVFRKNKMGYDEFPAQLRFAIADVLRDTEVTKACYRAGYDQDWSIELNTQMWEDVNSSLNYLNKIRFRENRELNQEQWFQMINPIIDSLQNVYADQIEINTDAFEAIKITATDMVVSQKGVPYPVMVPSFPIITTDSRLDYGSKSKLDD